MFKLKRRKTDVDYLGYIDCSIGPTVQGWVIKKGSTDAVCIKVICGDEVRIVQADMYRPDIHKKGLHSTGLCGFKVHFSRSNINVATVEVLQTINSLRKSRESYRRHKLFLIHLPKTAGTSFNTLVKRSLGEDDFLVHIEGQRDNWEHIVKKRYLAGHVNYDRYATFFKNKGYSSIVFFREPISQLVSHLNWVRHIHDIQETDFAKNHPDAVKNIAQQLSLIDYASVAELQRFVRKMPKSMYGLFDNMQVRFMAGVPSDRRVQDVDVQIALNNLRNIQMIGITEKFTDSIRYISSVTDLDLDANGPVVENKAPFTYGFDSSNSRLVDAVQPLIKYDIQLYQAALKYFEVQFSQIQR